MNIETFLSALASIGSSPYALIGYIAVTIVWGLSIWRTSKLKEIASNLQKLPAKDRLQALALEYRLIPKGGWKAEHYLQYNKRQYIFLGFIATIIAILMLVSLATYKTLEEGKLNSALRSMSLALQVSKLGIINADQKSFAKSSGHMEAVLKAYPTFEGYMNLGYVYDELSNTKKAIWSYQKALSLKPNSPDALNSLGFAYKDAGQLDEAEKSLKLAIETTSVGSDIWFMAMSNLGNVYYERARNQKDSKKRKKLAQTALEKYYLPATKANHRFDNDDYLGRTYANIGNAYIITEDLDRANEFMEKALNIKRKISANKSLADTLNNKANLLLKQKQYTTAKPYLLEALRHFKSLGNDLGIAVTLFNLGEIAWAECDQRRAKSYYKEAREKSQAAKLGGVYERMPRTRLQQINSRKPPKFVLAQKCN